MPHLNARWLGAFQGRELKKYCYIIFVMKYYSIFLLILLGIVVSALVFHAGGPGSIPRLARQILHLPFSPLLLLRSPNLPQ
jgi:hypothetical protein